VKLLRDRHLKSMRTGKAQGRKNKIFEGKSEGKELEKEQQPHWSRLKGARNRGESIRPPTAEK